jgi:hypothetical protein
VSTAGRAAREAAEAAPGAVEGAVEGAGRAVPGEGGQRPQPRRRGSPGGPVRGHRLVQQLGAVLDQPAQRGWCTADGQVPERGLPDGHRGRRAPRVPGPSGHPVEHHGQQPRLDERVSRLQSLAFVHTFGHIAMARR